MALKMTLDFPGSPIETVQQITAWAGSWQQAIVRRLHEEDDLVLDEPDWDEIDAILDDERSCPRGERWELNCLWCNQDAGLVP